METAVGTTTSCQFTSPFRTSEKPIFEEIPNASRNAPKPTKSESEHAFQLGFIAMLGNVKAFILSICLAVVFAILLVALYGGLVVTLQALVRALTGVASQEKRIFPRSLCETK